MAFPAFFYACVCAFSLPRGLLEFRWTRRILRSWCNNAAPSQAYFRRPPSWWTSKHPSGPRELDHDLSGNVWSWLSGGILCSFLWFPFFAGLLPLNLIIIGLLTANNINHQKRKCSSSMFKDISEGCFILKAFDDLGSTADIFLCSFGLKSSAGWSEFKELIFDLVWVL